MNQNNSKAKCPLILRYHRLMDAFAKSDDERDFYLDKNEGFLLFADLDKDAQELGELEKELANHRERYAIIPKMSLYEIKKFMEGFVHEKVYDIDVKEKLLDIISAKEARENFLEFIYDNLTELEKWQQYYQERFRIRIIEWLRYHNFRFVFEEDLELMKGVVEKLKQTIFDDKVSKDVAQAREVILVKSKAYYSNEALNPKPKRGRPPKQIAKIEMEPEFSLDIYLNVPKPVRPFLYIPEITSAASVTFSAKFETEEHLLASLRGSARVKIDEKLEALSQKLASLQQLSSRLASTKIPGIEKIQKPFMPLIRPKLSELKKIEVSPDQGVKVGSAAKEAFPASKEGKGEEFSKRKTKFAIKKVSQINSKKKSKE